METTHISGIEAPVSRIGLGTWAIGGWMWGGTDDEASIQTIRRALPKFQPPRYSQYLAAAALEILHQ